MATLLADRVVWSGSPGTAARYDNLRPYAKKSSPSIYGCGRRPRTRGAQMKTFRSRSIIRASAWSALAAAGATFGLIGNAAAQQPRCTPQQPLQMPGVLCLDTPAPPDTVPVAQPD